jgi:hypothetical protein
MAFIAGPYTITWGGADIGQCVEPSVEHFVNKQLVRGDNQAQTPQDGVYQGMEVFVDFTMIELGDDTLIGVNARDTLWPYNQTTEGAQGQVGRLDVASSIAKSLVLTPTAGTTAAAVTADVFTATLAILAEGFPVRILRAPALAEAPIRMRLYPSATGVFYAWS